MKLESAKLLSLELSFDLFNNFVSFSFRVDQVGGSTNFVMGNSSINFIRYYWEMITL